MASPGLVLNAVNGGDVAALKRLLAAGIDVETRADVKLVFLLVYLKPNVSDWIWYPSIFISTGQLWLFRRELP